jgi:hypothetical protein
LSLEYQGRIKKNFLLRAEVGVISIGGASLSTSPKDISQDDIDKELKDLEDGSK